MVIRFPVLSRIASCVLLFASLGCERAGVVDGTLAEPSMIAGPGALSSDPELPIIELEVDAELYVSDPFGTPGAPGSTYQYQMTLAFDSTDLRVESAFSPTSLPELDPTEPVRLSTSVFDTFGEQLTVSLADGSSASVPTSMEEVGSFATVAPLSLGSSESSKPLPTRGARAFRGALQKSDYDRVLSGIAHRVNLEPAMLPKRVNDRDETALVGSSVEFDDNSVDSTWIDRRTWLLVREAYTNGRDRTSIRHEYNQVAPGFFVRTASTYELTVGEQKQTVRRRFRNVVLRTRGDR